MGHVESDEALQTTELIVRQPPDVGLAQVQGLEDVEAGQSTLVDVEADRGQGGVRVGVDTEVVEVVQPLQGGGGQAGQLAVGDGELLELGQMLETVGVQSGDMRDQLGTLDTERHRPLPRDHAEVGLVILGVDRPNKH